MLSASFKPTWRQLKLPLSPPGTTFSLLSIALVFEDPEYHLYPAFYQQAITIALKQAFGLTGETIYFEILEIEPEKGLSTIKIYSEFVKKVWCALTLFHEYDKCRCRFDVLKIDNSVIKVQ